MSIVTTAALALLLAVDPPAAPPPPEPATPSAGPAAAAPPADLAAPVPDAAPPPAALAVTATVAPTAPPTTSTATRLVRAGFGVSVSNADSGYASTVGAGIEVDPWRLFGFRAGLGMTTRQMGDGGWDAAELNGSVLFRPIGGDHWLAPYLGAGVQFALLAVYPDATAAPPQARLAGGHLAPTFLGDSGFNSDQRSYDFAGNNQFKVLPEVAAGALVRLNDQLKLDVEARYLPLSWNGTTYNGFSVLASLCAPF